eukprot:7945341-Lingulodinium_polyedra.AAC.1
MPLDISEAEAEDACRGATPLPPAPDRALQLLPGDIALLAEGAGGGIATAAAGEHAEIVATAN